MTFTKDQMDSMDALIRAIHEYRPYSNLSTRKTHNYGSQLLQTR